MTNSREPKPKKPKKIQLDDVQIWPHRPPTRNNPCWSWRARRGASEWIWSGRGTREEVKEQVLNALAVRTHAPQVEAAPEVVFVGDMIELWLGGAELRHEEGQIATDTLEHYDAIAKKLKPLTPVPIASLGTAIEDHKSAQLRAGMATSYVNQQLTCVRMAWRFCSRRGYLTTGEPVWPKLKTIARWEKKTPTKGEVLKLWEGAEPKDPADPWEKEIILFTASTGARQRENSTLKWPAFDSAGRRVLLNGKTGPRWIPLRGDVLQMMRERRMRISGSSEYVWSVKSRPMEWNRNQLKKAAEAAGLGRLTSHSLRRHFCVELISAMFSRGPADLDPSARLTPKDYERLAGHSFQVGMKAYINSRSESREAAIELAGLGTLG